MVREVSANGKVSKLPWRVNPLDGLISTAEHDRPAANYRGFVDSDNSVQSRADNEANAAFIVLAVNAHEALVEALEAVQKWDRCEPGRKQLFWSDAQSAIDAALRLAKGGGA